jgi:imidazolonepropionase
MKFAMSLACIKMRLCPAEALNAATINAAHAMGLGRELGSIAIGKRAHLILTDHIPSLDFIPYAYTSPIIKKTIIGETVIG